MNKGYNHYFKGVKNLEYIDVYRVLDLFDVVDPAIQHAVKKLLVAGERGYKNMEKDVREAIVSLNRWLDMRREDEYESDGNLGNNCISNVCIDPKKDDTVEFVVDDYC